MSLINQVQAGDPPGFFMYGGKREHPDCQARYPGGTEKEWGLEQNGLHRLHGTCASQTHSVQPAIPQ